MSRIRIVVADDELYVRKIVKKYLRKHASIDVIGEAANGLKAMELITQLKPDLVFLAMQMPVYTGLEVVSKLKDCSPPLFIFTAASNEYAVSAFDVNAVDFLLKPFNQQRLDFAFNKAEALLRARNQNVFSYQPDKVNEKPKFLHRILIKEIKRMFFIATAAIYWFEASGDYVMLHTESKSHLLKYGLNELEQKLSPDKFVRIHRSTIINVDFIQEFEPHFNGEYFITLQNKTRLKMSRTFRDGLKTHFADLFEP